jgi:hypothetical protein
VFDVIWEDAMNFIHQEEDLAKPPMIRLKIWIIKAAVHDDLLP